MGDSRVHTEAKSTVLPSSSSTLERSSFLQRNPDENELETIQEKSLNSSEQFSASPPLDPPFGGHSFGQVSAYTFAAPRIQPKLTIGQPDDQYEQEADQVADRVVRSQEYPPDRSPRLQFSLLQRAPLPEHEEDTEEPIQTQAEPGQLPEVTPALETQLAASKGQGQPLSDQVRSHFEPRMGVDFSQVRVHTDSNALVMNQALNAQAFTHGQDIYFGIGKYDPTSETGKRLLAHELTHVVQQSGTIQRQPSSTAELPVSAPEASEEPAVEETQTLQEPSSDETSIRSTEQYTSEQSEENQPSAKIAEFNPSSLESSFESAANPGSETGAIAPQIASPVPANQPEIAPETEQPDESQVELTEATQPLPALSASAPNSPALPFDPPTIQRQEEEEDSGLLGGIRRRINSIVDGLRSGWDRLSQMAQSAFEGIRDQFGSVVEELGGFVSSALSGIQTGWSTLSQMATTLTEGIKQQMQGAIASVTGAARAMADAVMRLDVNGIRAAWGQLTGMIGGIWQRLQQMGQAVFQRIAQFWTGLQSQLTGILTNLANRVRDMLNRLQSVVQGIRQRLASAWDAIRNRASQMSGVLGGILDRLRSLVESLLSWGQRIWNSIQQQWSSLRDRVGTFLQQIWQRITMAAQGLRQRATALWQRITSLWTRLQQWVQQQVQRLVSGVRSIWDRFRNFSIGKLIDKIAKYAPFIRSVQQAVEDPDSAMTPIVDAIAGKLDAEMPARSIDIGSQHLQEQAGPSLAGGMVLPAVNQQQSNGGVIQRQPTTASPVLERRTASLSEIWEGFSTAITLKWRQVDIWKMVKEMLWSLIWPWPGVGRELSELWNEDLKSAVQSLFSIQSISQDPLGALHDLWSNFRHLLDIPLAIWRRINNILLLLSGWITLFLVVLGAIGGTFAGGVIGGILSGLVSLGVATPAGAAAGAGAGGLTGAGAGFAAAMGLGYVFLVSFAAGETVTFLKTLGDLLTGRQTEEERRRDYSQLADSLIALGITVVLVVLSYIAARLASAVLGLVKRILPPRIQAVIERLETRLRGLPDEDPARKLETGARDGLEASPETVRDGSVRMEEHPSYRSTLDEIRRLGFEVKKTAGDPYVSVREVLSPEGQVIRVEKSVFVRDGMRFLDLEHELGHIRQLTERFGENPLPTERVIESPDGRTKQARDQQGVLTNWQNTITEYHNRLVEFLRLHERGASPELLREHAGGVREWRSLYLDKGLKGGRSPSRQSWVQEHFPDLPQLVDRYNQAGGRGLEPR
ncbi:MAG: DUF4157 domain-containing protein [Phormidium tanganyikae FI6-MK23]|jgi:flagellar biosynthesis/type III secretory pathway chaperone|nr:DUF4157 domain-containing protein [Phormidium tanganyikae FI6-MK23]